jgi:hypothetical protein
MTFVPHPPPAGETGTRVTLGFPPDAPVSTEASGPAITWEATLWACPNPTCRCGTLTFECLASAALEDPSTPSAGSRVRFTLDVFDRTLARTTKDSPEGQSLGSATVRGLSPENWEWLHRLFLADKARAVAEMDVETVRVEFPPDLRPGEMVAYQELFEWAERFVYTSDDAQRWLVDDAYCTKPGCTCREILLHFFRVPSTSPGTRVQLGNPDVTLRRDLSTGRITELHRDRSCPSPITLNASLLKHYPGLDATLEQRRKQVQRVARRIPSQGTSPTPPPQPVSRATPKIGRNEPCPCGSGRKYKHCCAKSG